MKSACMWSVCALFLCAWMILHVAATSPHSFSFRNSIPSAASPLFRQRLDEAIQTIEHEWASIEHNHAQLEMPEALSSLFATFSPFPSTPRAAEAVDDYSSTIEAAFGLIEESQQNTTTPWIFPLSEQKLKGIYPSYIHLNFLGSRFLQVLRQFVGFFDNNQFVTMWVLQLLIEAQRLGGIQLTDTQVLRGLNLTLQFHENDDDNTTGSMDFWKERFYNNSWQQYPTNVAGPIQLLAPISQLLNAWCAKQPSVCNFAQAFANFADMMSDYLSAFGIPADFDDSSVNLALGYLLNQASSDLPQSWSKWIGASWNVNPSKLFNQFVEYSYRPFSDDFNSNCIDPRTYYYIRTYLEAHKEKALKEGRTPNLMLSTTWIDNILNSDENYWTKHKMPFLTNNVDGSVMGNSMFGLITTIMLHAPLDGSGDYATFLTDDVKQLMGDSIDLIAWIIESNILLQRNDLVLLYYPPVADFYYFAARSLHLLQSTDLTAVFGMVYNDIPTLTWLTALQKTLDSALVGTGTQTILQLSQSGVSANTTLPITYWDEFLGNADVNSHNESSPNYDDRLFTTSVYVNALTAIWTTDTIPSAGNASVSMAWRSDAPANVIQLVTQACSFLDEELVAGTYLPMNAFFSGSVKGHTTLPFNYPINYWRDINGTVIPFQNITWDEIEDTLGTSFTGVVTETEYQSMMTNNPLGVSTPTSFRGYNVDGVGMVFWSATPLTYAAGLLALTKCTVLGAIPSTNQAQSTIEAAKQQLAKSFPGIALE